MLFRTSISALTAAALLMAVPALAQAPATPSGKSDTKTDGAMKKKDGMTSGGMMMKSGGMSKDGSGTSGMATKTGGPSGGVPGKS